MLDYIISSYHRRKFRSQTSDNMERWKAEQGRGREKRKIRRERVRRQKLQMREKVGKSRNTVFSQWFGALEGRKVGSLKRRVRSQLARWAMKNCTPLWREAHFQVKMYKTHHCRTTFGSCDVEKMHAVVARSTFWSQNIQNTPASDHFWKLRCRKSARRCGAKHILTCNLSSLIWTTWLRTRRTRPFNEPTFRPSGATDQWKNTVFLDFATFSRTCIFFSPTLFSSLIFSLLLFSCLTLPTPAFPYVHIVGSLTAKLPSFMG